MSSLSTKGQPASFSSAQQLAGYLLDQTSPDHNVAAIEHRQRLVQAWNIPLGSKILEIGCGQGDSTVVLADAVGPTGRVVAVDSCPPGWGTPDVLTAQAHLATASPFGSRIEFLNEDPAAYLAALETTATPVFDFIVFIHCIWFFDKPSVLMDILVQSRVHASGVLIGEYGMSISSLAGLPHLLAGQYNHALEVLLPDRPMWNIRSALSPAQISATVLQEGWNLTAEQMISSGSGQIEGWREVTMVLRSKVFSKDLEDAQLDEQVRTLLRAMKQAVALSVERLDEGLKGVRNMDVWVARFDNKKKDKTGSGSVIA